MLFVLYNNDLILSHTTGGLSGLRWTFSLGFSHVVDIMWQLEVGWLSKMAHSLGWPLSGLDQMAYLWFLHITWTSHRMTASLSWSSNRQKQPEAASLWKPGPTQLPFYVLWGSIQIQGKGTNIPLPLTGKSVKGFVAIFNHTFCMCVCHQIRDSGIHFLVKPLLW